MLKKELSVSKLPSKNGGFFIKGIVQRIESKDYYIFDDSGNLIRSNLRGKFKKIHSLKKDKSRTLDIVTVGDIVEYQLNEDGSGTINSIFERKNYISRKAIRQRGAGERGERLEQIIASNIDNLFIVTSIDRPQFNNKFLDRLLVVGESSHVDITIIINKVDLDTEDLSELWEEFYNEIGYEVILASVKEMIGAESIMEKITGSKNIFWGQSGVGKSSLLNGLFPELNLKTSSVSDYSNKGKHTTVTSSMISLGNNTFVIDTPGIREIDPYGISKENLGHYFKDFLPFINDCKFNTCTHHHEPGCAIIANVENENIALERYESYLNILDTIEEGIIF